MFFNIKKDSEWKKKNGDTIIKITDINGDKSLLYFETFMGYFLELEDSHIIPVNDLIRDYIKLSKTEDEDKTLVSTYIPDDDENTNDTANDANNDNNDNTNYIKMDGEKDAFEGGAIRYTKTGKGRFDLIPGEVVQFIMEQAKKYFFENNNKLTVTQEDVLLCAYDTHGYHRYYDTIINIVLLHYAPSTIDHNIPHSLKKIVLYSDFVFGMCEMLRDLAIHYENGAEKYGVDNWKKGIPLIGDNRGGSFTDSGLRHLNQYLLNMNDEPHHISCIWNFFGALWTILNENKDHILDEEVTEK